MRSLTPTVLGTGSLVAAVATFLAAAVFSLPALLYASFLLVALVVGALLLVLVGQSRLRVQRSFAPHVAVPGSVVTATVRVSNGSLLPCVDAAWHDTMPTSVTAEAHGVLPALGGRRSPRSRVMFSYELAGRQRGRHSIGPLEVTLTDPFGLVARRVSAGEADPLVVLPRVVDLSAVDLALGDAGGSARPLPHHAGVGDDDIIARPYLPGDAMKRLHWKATARTGELMVRQEEQQVDPRATLVLGVDPREHGTARDRQGEWEYSPSLEWAVVAAASAATELVRTGHVVTVRTGDGQVHRVVGEGHDTLEDVLVDLALVQPGETTSSPVEPDGSMLVVLGRLDEQGARAWVRLVRERPRALVEASSPSSALDVLAAAGWRWRTYHARDEVAACWSDLVGQSRAAG